MKYADTYKEKKGIFETIFLAEYPVEYAKIFGDINPKNVDMMALLQHGNKTLIYAIDHANYIDAISSVIVMNVGTWVKTAEVLALEYDVINPITGEMTISETATREENRTNDITNSKKYFNDGEFTDGQRETAETAQGWEETKNRTHSNSGIGNSNNISESIQKEIDLRQLNYQKKVISLLVSDITLDIY